MNLLKTISLTSNYEKNFKTNGWFLCNNGLSKFFPFVKNKTQIQIQIRKNPCKKKGEKKFLLKHEKNSRYTDVEIDGKVQILAYCSAANLNILREKHDLKQIYVTIK